MLSRFIVWLWSLITPKPTAADNAAAVHEIDDAVSAAYDVHAPSEAK